MKNIGQFSNADNEAVVEELFDAYSEAEEEDESSVFDEEPDYQLKNRRFSTCEQLIKRAVMMSPKKSAYGISETKTDRTLSMRKESIAFIDDNEDFLASHSAPTAASQLPTLNNLDEKSCLNTPASLTCNSSTELLSPTAMGQASSGIVNKAMSARRTLLETIPPNKGMIRDTSVNSDRSIMSSSDLTTRDINRSAMDNTLIDTDNPERRSPFKAKIRAIDTVQRIGAQRRLSTMRQSVIEVWERRNLKLLKNGQIRLSSRASWQRSLTRKFIKSQRKEKKATKMLAIVVGKLKRV